MPSSISLQRFLIPLDKLAACLPEGASSEVFYQSTARSHLFHLQALCRIYRKSLDKIPFKELGEQCKAWEDQLGAVDYWDGWLKQISTRKEFPTKAKKCLENHKAEELDKLQSLLADFTKWMAETRRTLEEVDWQKPEKDRKKIAAFLADEWSDIEKDYLAGEYDFTLLEEGVHEFRRDVRWFSIYAAALNGLIQLKPRGKDADFPAHYVADKIANSPFNRMPSVPSGAEPLYLTDAWFYALSYLIGELGSIKDAGQHHEAMDHLAKEAEVDIEQLLDHDQLIDMEQITSRVTTLADDFSGSIASRQSYVQSWKTREGYEISVEM